MKRKTGMAMSGAERAEKKRRKASLFPAKAATSREKDAERKRKAPSDESAQRQGDAAEEAERAATASSSSSAEVRQARDQHTTLLRLTFGDTVEEAELAAPWGEDAEERQQWEEAVPWVKAEREWRQALEARAAGEGWSDGVVQIMSDIKEILEDAASFADEVRDGAKANEWRRQANALATIEAPTEQAMCALLRDAEDAWRDVRDRVLAEGKAAEQRGETWWYDLWSSRDQEATCEAWRGLLPPYGSTPPEYGLRYGQLLP